MATTLLKVWQKDGSAAYRRRLPSLTRVGFCLHQDFWDAGMSRMDCGLRRNDGRAARAPTRDALRRWWRYAGIAAGGGWRNMLRPYGLARTYAGQRLTWGSPHPGPFPRGAGGFPLARE